MLNKNYNIEQLENTIDMVKDIIYMYDTRRLSIPIIAGHLGLTYHTVRTILKENNVNIRPKNNH